MKHLLLFICSLSSMYLVAQPPDKVNNIYGYEKVVVLELTAEGDNWRVEVKKVCQGVPTKSVVSDRSIKMDFIDTKGKEMYSVSVGNPKMMKIHSEESPVTEKQQSVAASIMVVVPYDPKCVKVVCSEEQKGKSSTVVKKETFRIRDAIAKAEGRD